MGYTRARLQARLGLPDAGACNYCLYSPVFFMCMGKCALCQESRAVKARWRATNADNRSGIAKPIMPSQPAGPGGYIAASD